MARNGKNILIVHQNFPAQFVHIGEALRKRGDKVAAIGGKTSKGRPGIDLRRWTNSRNSTPDLFRHLVKSESDLIRAEAAAGAARQLQRDGFKPDLIVAHPGWGETLHLKEIFPGVPMILFAEYFYKTHGSDADFDQEFDKLDDNGRMRINALNTVLSQSCLSADRIICPTGFQASTFPAVFQPNIRVIHEGIDLRKAQPHPNPRLKLKNGRVLTRETPVITYVSRYLEPMRGFHIFMRALPKFMAQCPQADVVVIGSAVDRGYGSRAPDKQTWKQVFLKEVGDRINPDRIHFMGKVPHDEMVQAMSLSLGHVYYTVPFVLSWSLIEAMACGCNIIASDTTPLHDAITHGVNGTLVNYFDTDALADALTHAVRHPEASAPLRAAARDTATRGFGTDAGVAAWLQAIDELL